MAQRSIEILIGRLVTDEAFRSAFRRHPEATVIEFVECGYELTPVEIASVRATPADVWEWAAARVDPRLQKAALSEEEPCAND